MYQYAIDNYLVDPVCYLAGAESSAINREGNWTLYIDVKDSSLIQYNKEHGTNYKSKYDKEVYNIIPLESYSDEPRIGGYPDKIIHNYQEMLDFMKIGFIDDEGQQHDFYYDNDRYDNFMRGIKTFFEKHPDGIITFG